MDHRTIVSFFTCQLVWVNRYLNSVIWRSAFHKNYDTILTAIDSFDLLLLFDGLKICLPILLLNA